MTTTMTVDAKKSHHHDTSNSGTTTAAPTYTNTPADNCIKSFGPNITADQVNQCYISNPISVRKCRNNTSTSGPFYR